MVLQDPGDAKDRSTYTGKTSRHAEEAFHIRERETAATLLTRRKILGINVVCICSFPECDLV